MKEQMPSAMDELLRRTSDMIGVYCQDYSDEPWRQNVDAIQCFQRLPLTGLPESLQQHIEKKMVQISRVLSRYPIKTFKYYAMISDEDHARIRKLVEGIAFGYRKTRARH